MRLDPYDELRFPDYRVLRFLLEKPLSTKYAIERELSRERKMAGKEAHWSHGTLYGAVSRLKKGGFIGVGRVRKTRVGDRMEFYILTLLGLFRALRSCRLIGRKVDMNKVAMTHSKLLPEILGQWEIFRENHVEELAGSRLFAIADNLGVQMGLTTIHQYMHDFLPGELKRIHQEEKEITNMRIMRVFIFGSDDEQPFPLSWGKVNWTSSLQRNPALRKSALRIARIYINRFTKAASNWEQVLNELEWLE